MIAPQPRVLLLGQSLPVDQQEARTLLHLQPAHAPGTTHSEHDHPYASARRHLVEALKSVYGTFTYEVNGDGLSRLETPSVLGGDSVEDEDDEDVDEEYRRAMNAVTYQCLKLAIHPEQPEVHLGFFLYRPIAPLVVELADVVIRKVMLSRLVAASRASESSRKDDEA